MYKERFIVRILAMSLLLLSLGACKVTSNQSTSTGDSSASSNDPSVAAIFALMDPSDSSVEYSKYLTLNSVDGIAIRAGWDRIQPANEASYNWSQVDEAFAQAKRLNKKVTLHVVNSVYGNTPSWVYSAGAQSYTYQRPTGEIKTDPIPWDSTYLAKWSVFLRALSDHLASLNYTPQLEYISIAAPTPEMSLGACKLLDLNGDYPGITAYARSAYMGAWKSVILATHNAFPNTKKLLPTPVQHICFSDKDGGPFYEELFRYAKTLSPSAFAHYATDLSATDSGSRRLDQIGNVIKDADVALQYTWSYTQDYGSRLGGSLLTATCEKGLKNFQGRYFEVYKPDLDNPDSAVQLAITAIHEPGVCP